MSRAPRRVPFVVVQIVILLGSSLLTGCGQANPAPGSPPPGEAVSPVPGVPTVGELADRIARAWVGVRTYRSVFTTTQQVPGTPAPSVVTIEVIEEAIPPDRKHRVTRENGVVVSEFISVEGKIYARGAILPGVDTPQPDPNGWFVINPGSLEASSQAASLYAVLAAPPPPPIPHSRQRSACATLFRSIR